MDHLAGGLRDGLDPDLVVVVEFLGLTRLTELIHAQTQRLAAEHAPDEGKSMRVAVQVTTGTRRSAGGIRPSRWKVNRFPGFFILSLPACCQPRKSRSGLVTAITLAKMPSRARLRLASRASTTITPQVKRLRTFMPGEYPGADR